MSVHTTDIIFLIFSMQRIVMFLCFIKKDNQKDNLNKRGNTNIRNIGPALRPECTDVHSAHTYTIS